MAQETGQERTEQPTQKRLKDARDKGQIARSKDLNTMVMVLGAAAFIYFMGGRMVGDLRQILVKGLSIKREDVLNTGSMLGFLGDAATSFFSMLAPFFMMMVILAVAAPLLMGGWSFSTQAMAFKGERINPISGISRIFSWKSLIELVKSLAKFLLITAIFMAFLWFYSGDILQLGNKPVMTAMTDAGNIIAYSFLVVSLGLVVIAAIDVPFQLWEYTRQLKMTRQEIRDEFKETDGHPEVRSKIRALQREMAQRRMMAQVPKADVIVTNPTHYAVALKYDQARMRAPVVVAKGADLVAANIRSIAEKNNVPILSAPPLARSLYYSTELDKEIPTGLYTAVAQILAYVYQLRKKGRYGMKSTIDLNNLPIPERLRRDN